ncbi:tetratricopeptide repeat protein [Chrysiogenes arsenatis]|uniref:tetratricopeptide repeat protein n=1 Tax=Chrysiogenes arsenatis TaxID=309797 RepID=UPI000413FB18|nr:hypothetical protein [Chrysiogenes arsenatis]
MPSHNPLKMMLFPLVVIALVLLATKWDIVMTMFSSKNFHLIEAHMNKSADQLVKETKIPPGGVKGESIPLSVFRKDGGSEPQASPPAPSPEAVRQDVDQAKVWFMKAKEHEERGEYAEALEAYARSFTLDQENAEAFFRHGMISYDMESRAVGTESLRRAVALQGDNVEYRVELARKLVQNREPEAALTHVREALRRDPHNRAALNLHEFLSR